MSFLTNHPTKEFTFLLITANVGSIFEDPEGLLKIWVDEFLKTINQMKPMFIALHCQEIGGKTYELSMKNVRQFVTKLIESEALAKYRKVRAFLDEDFTCTKNFTALGSFYFIHEKIEDVKIWNFQDKSFYPIDGKEIFSGNIEDVPFKEKAKFPQEFFPNCKWSRKGFMRIRWLIDGWIFDLTNIHLFHDASNFTAIESFPSPYSTIRQHALQYVLDRFQKDAYDKVPLFIFGDFNFRLDTKAIVEKITKNHAAVHFKSENNGAIERILYNDPDLNNKTTLTLEKKVFDLVNHDETFFSEQNHHWLLDLDKEFKFFEDQLFEFDITFPPSYPFSENSTKSSYMKTRCPAWCDRILLNKPAMDLIRSNYNSTENLVKYEMMGKTVPMGDHKPIFLEFKLAATEGKLRSGFSLLSRKKRNDIMHDYSSQDNNNKRSRLRTFSIPSLNRPVHSHPKARRTASAASSCKPIFHNKDWYLRTQELFKSLREASSLKTKGSSSRLTSHHSSSSEEWYSDLPEDLINYRITRDFLDQTENEYKSEQKTNMDMASASSSSPLKLTTTTTTATLIKSRLSDVNEIFELQSTESSDYDDSNGDKMINSEQRRSEPSLGHNGVLFDSIQSHPGNNTLFKAKPTKALKKRRKSCPVNCSVS